MPKYRVENPAERLQVEEPKARCEGCCRLPWLKALLFHQASPSIIQIYVWKLKIPKNKKQHKGATAVCLEQSPALLQPLPPLEEGRSCIYTWTPSPSGSHPALPTRWESQVPLLIAVDLPLAWARTCLITATFNYCTSFPTGFQPISVFMSHP